MKKYIIPLIFISACSAAAFASSGKKMKDVNEVSGKIVSVDQSKKTVTLQDANDQKSTFEITPLTRIRYVASVNALGNRTISGSPGGYSDLSVNQWARVHYVGSGNIKTAKDVTYAK